MCSPAVVTAPIRTLGSNGAIKQAARAGLGISLQSRLATHLEVDLGLLATIHVDVPLPQRHWYVIRPAHGPLRPAVEQFLQFVHSDEARNAVEKGLTTPRARAQGDPAPPRPGP